MSMKKKVCAFYVTTFLTQNPPFIAFVDQTHYCVLEISKGTCIGRLIPK